MDGNQFLIHESAVVVQNKAKRLFILTTSFSLHEHLVKMLCVYSRSRDVAELLAEMTFDPSKINLQQTCQVHGKNTVCVKIRVCFRYRIKSEKDKNTGTGKGRACMSDTHFY